MNNKLDKTIFGATHILRGAQGRQRAYEMAYDLLQRGVDDLSLASGGRVLTSVDTEAKNLIKTANAVAGHIAYMERTHPSNFSEWIRKAIRNGLLCLSKKFDDRNGS